MRVDVSCRACGRSERIEIGAPKPGQAVAEFLHLVRERLTHRPSFRCFGGHVELRPPLPEFWDIRWETLGDD